MFDSDLNSTCDTLFYSRGLHEWVRCVILFVVFIMRFDCLSNLVDKSHLYNYYYLYTHCFWFLSIQSLSVNTVYCATVLLWLMLKLFFKLLARLTKLCDKSLKNVPKRIIYLLFFSCSQHLSNRPT